MGKTFASLDKFKKFASENEIFVALLTSRYASSKLLLAPSGDGFIAFKGPEDSMFREFFQFKCTMAGCEWIESNQKFKEEHYHPVIMYIPNSLTDCRQKTQEEVQAELKDNAEWTNWFKGLTT